MEAVAIALAGHGALSKVAPVCSACCSQVTVLTTQARRWHFSAHTHLHPSLSPQQSFRPLLGYYAESHPDICTHHGLDMVLMFDNGWQTGSESQSHLLNLDTDEKYVAIGTRCPVCALLYSL